MPNTRVDSDTLIYTHFAVTGRLSENICLVFTLLLFLLFSLPRARNLHRSRPQYTNSTNLLIASNLPLLLDTPPPTSPAACMSSFNDFTLNEYIAVTAFAVIIGTALSYTPIPGNPSIPSETVPSWSAHAASRALVITTARLMNTTGINQGTSGNVSLRVTDGFLITPSGIPYDTMTPAQVTFFSLAATTGYYGPCKPSSEYRMHRDMYLQFPACNSIVHAHSTFATVLSAQRRAIPAFHYMVGVAGGKIIPCAECE